MWPQSPLEDLKILSDLTGWFSCQDDLADEDLSRAPEALEHAIRQVLQMASSGRGTSAGLAGGLTDIIARAAIEMPAEWEQRTLEQYVNYLYPCLRASVHRMEGTQPEVADFNNAWRNAGGFQVCFEFTYFAQRVHLPSRVYYSSVWQELRRLTLNLFKAVNDVLSFGIMENPDEDVYNLLTHLRHHQKLSPDDAAAEVNRRIETWVAAFHLIEQRLPIELERLGCDTPSCAQALRCAEAFKVQWQGNVGWHLAVPRYRETRFTQA
ncbi:hypothetical protein GIW70_02845 [Pseudomonas syringae]|nr:hypothetical protein [Pseudomonas syringae]MCF5067134.1 hypothetical protein [Pseudomonas syringae]